MFKPKPVEAEVAVSEPEPAPAPTAPPKPLEDVRKNRVKPPRPPRGKAVHLVEDEEESAPTETAPSPPAESLAESEIPPPIPPLPPIDFGSPIDLGISGLGDAGQEHVSEPEPVASVESIHWDESLADVTTVATTPSQLPESHSETTPLPPVAAPVSAPAAVPAPAVPPPALPPVPPRRSVPRTPATEEPHHDIEAATPEAEHPPVPRPPPALSLDHAPPVPVSPTAMHHAPPETPPRSSSEGKALPTVPAPSPAAQASHGPVPVTGLPAAAVPSISAPAVPPPHTPSLPPAPTPSTSSPLPMPAAAPMSMVTSVEHAQQEEKKGGMFSKMKSVGDSAAVLKIHTNLIDKLHVFPHADVPKGRKGKRAIPYRLYRPSRRGCAGS